jgi:hypothetical protein
MSLFSRNYESTYDEAFNYNVSECSKSNMFRDPDRLNWSSSMSADYIALNYRQLAPQNPQVQQRGIAKRPPPPQKLVELMEGSYAPFRSPVELARTAQY